MTNVPMKTWWFLLAKASPYVAAGSVGVLAGMLLCAPLIGWQLSESASTVLSSAVAAVGGAAGAVALWQAQEATRDYRITNLVLTDLEALLQATLRVIENLHSAADGCMKIKMIVDGFAKELEFEDLWRGLGPSQCAFDLQQRIALAALVEQVHRLRAYIADYRHQQQAAFLIPCLIGESAADIVVQIPAYIKRVELKAKRLG